MDASAEPGPSGSGHPAGTALAESKGLQLKDLLAELGQPNPSPLSGSRDLLSLFNLIPQYDTYVRPYLPPSASSTTNAESPDNTLKSSVKGKEKEKEGITSIGITIGGVRIGGPAATPDEGAGGKAKRNKMESKYLHMVQDIPGRNLIKKDNHLRDLVLNPDPQPVLINPLDDQTLREAFSLRPGQIAGFDSHTWESQADQPGKKKKKKRKHDHDSGPGANGNGNGVSNGKGEEDHRKKKKRKGDSP